MATADSSCAQVRNSGMVLRPYLIRDSCSPRKLEAGLAGKYLMSSVLITSTMKSEPATPPMRDKSLGVPVSAAATRMLGGRAEGGRGADAGDAARVSAHPPSGTVLAVPATPPLPRNFRRFTPPPPPPLSP